MRFALFALLSPLAFLHAGELSLTGQVVDRSGRGVPYAAVECAGKSVSTDSTGQFALQGVDRCAAKVTRSGFESAEAELHAGEQNRIELTLAIQSEKVVVSATRVPVTLEESGVSATVFNHRDVEARQFPPVLDMLRDVPGMAVVNTSRRGGLTSVFTRGGASTSTLVLLDGVPLNEPGGQIDFAHLTTAGLERVEAIRGPESTLFGAEAAGGVVQLFTARGDPESALPHGKLSYERGNLETDRWTANLNGGILGRIDYSLTAEQFHTAGMFPNDFYRNTNGTANLGWRITPSTEVRGIYREYATENGNPNQVAYGLLNRDSEAQNRASTLLVRVDDVRTPHFAQRFSFGYNRLGYRSTEQNLYGPFNIAALTYTEPNGAVLLDRLVDPSFAPSQVPAGLTLVRKSVTLYPYSSTSFSDRKTAEYQGAYTHPGGTLVFGYDYERQDGLISRQAVERDNHGGYVHEQYRWGKRVFFTGGVRVEQSSTFGTKTAPRGSVTVALAGEHGLFTTTLLRFSAGRGITEPSLLENFARESYYVGNAALRPEKTTSYDLGFVQELWGRRIRAEVTAFRNNFDDLIVYDSGAYPGTWRNIDRSWGRGVETIVTLKPLRNVQVSGEWTRLYTRIVNTRSTAPYAKIGQELLRRPKDSGSAWISVTPRRWSLIFGGRFVSERQDADFVFGLTRNPGYGTAYISGSYAVSKHFTPYFRVDNLFDERYQEVLGYTSLSRNGVGGIRVTW